MTKIGPFCSSSPVVKFTSRSAGSTVCSRVCDASKISTYEHCRTVFAYFAESENTLAWRALKAASRAAVAAAEATPGADARTDGGLCVHLPRTVVVRPGNERGPGLGV